jgi:DNA primase
MQFNNVFNNWLKTNKISDQVQQDFDISFTDEIVIPISDASGNFLFNKYRRSPLKTDGAKYRYDVGGKVTLYAWHKAKDCAKILITEGEKDTLVAWSHNIPAVTSTGGAQSFQKDWGQLFTDKEVVICLDNDNAGAEGMVKMLSIIPHASILLLPDMPNVKDISDYVNAGGNLHELLKTARRFENIAEVTEDRSKRIALFKSVFFHDSYIRAHTKVENAKVRAERKTYSNDAVTQARNYPITDLLTFVRNKACCPYHKERTPSLHYYEKTNTCYCFGGCGKRYDAIDIYMKQHGVGFVEAVKRLQ